MLVFGYSCGWFVGLLILVNDCLKPSGFTDREIGNIGASMGSGMFGCIFFGVLEGSTEDVTYLGRRCAMFSFFFLTAFGILVFWLKHTETSWILPTVSLGLAAFFGMPMLPLLMDMGIEVLFPVSESVVGSLLWLSGNVSTLLVVLVAGQLDIPALGSYRRAPTFLLFWCLSAISVFCMSRLRVRGGFKRMQYEIRKRSSQTMQKLSSPATAFVPQKDVPQRDVPQRDVVPPLNL